MQSALCKVCWDTTAGIGHVNFYFILFYFLFHFDFKLVLFFFYFHFYLNFECVLNWLSSIFLFNFILDCFPSHFEKIQWQLSATIDLKQVMSQGHILTTTRKVNITWMPAKRHSVGQMENYARLMITNPEHKSVSYIMVKRYLLVTKGKFMIKRDLPGS